MEDPWVPFINEGNRNYYEGQIKGHYMSEEDLNKYRDYVLQGTIGKEYGKLINAIDQLRNELKVARGLAD